MTLSNGGTAVAEGLLSRAGLRDEFERVLSVEQAGVWKPAPASYAYAARECGVGPRDAAGGRPPVGRRRAIRAGLAGCWLNRTGAPLPVDCREPTYTFASLP